ncbi:hypothetical protein DAEQUDRAFT_723911 [Daedalea quercina L-15889]|uniref:F-box domain-containing protein n=1 Tax=Daedalea quercina L-15889 TaxID=1314783 RepID=A0A165SD60_9APHY|nr:hypothetical protein DAEQUDRAFT_723911 [Daedalea quercina L-15889]
MPRKVAVERNRGGVQSAPKQPEGGRKHLRGKRGGLKDMPTMPLDILLEILCSLEPRDLLNLARTTKPFRAFLMSRGSAGMWKAARANVKGLPDCPPHLSEPVYANLVFFPYCHNCLKSNVQTILWEFSKRYCPACAKTLTIAQQDIWFHTQHSWSAVYLDLDIFSVIYGKKEVYHGPELDRIKSVWDRIHKDDAAWSEFVTEQRQRVTAARQHAGWCRVWERQRAANRSEELHEIREQRLETIVSKLRELGWGDELDRIELDGYRPLCDHAHVRPSKALTDRAAWAKIRDEVVAFMEVIRETRLRIERRQMIRRRLSALKTMIALARSAPPKRTVEDEYKPRFQDLAMMPEVREVIEAPDPVAVDERALKLLIPMLPALEARWQYERRAELMALLGRRVGAPGGLDPLELATTWFRCSDCERLMHYPVVLAHECQYIPLPHEVATRYDGYQLCIVEVCDYLPWDTSSIELVSRHSSRADVIVEMCGRDPAVTTQKDMDDAGLRLVCEDPYLGGVVMSWRRAVKYMYEQQRWDFKTHRWSIATEEEKEAVKDRETTEKARMFEKRARVLRWCCGYCNISRLSRWASSVCLSLDGVKKHLETQHAIENPTIANGDMYLHPDNNVELDPIPIRKHPYDRFVDAMQEPWSDFI